jgi:hypothetical protein
MHSATTTTKETEMTELASWITDGVSLPWNRRRNESRVTADRSGTAATSKFEAPRSRADGYYEAHRSETYDRIALRGPIL